MRYINSVALAAALFTAAMPAAAQGKSGKGAKGSSGGASVSAVVVFESAHRPVLVDYFRSRSITPKALPPGIAKNVMRGKPLPPGIAKKALPPSVIVINRNVGPDITLILVGDRVVAMRNGVVLDILIVL